MKQETLAITLGKDFKKNAGTVNPPIHKTSTVLFESWEAYLAADRDGKDVYGSAPGQLVDLSYGISGTPTTFTLQQTLATLEGADQTFVTSSGLSAITLALMSFLDAGDHILMVDTVYGPTRRFCNRELKRFGIETTYYDPLMGSDVQSLFRKNTRVVFTEAPGSLTFEMQDIPALSRVAHEHGAVVMMDNSWATSFYFKPFDHGVDVSIQAGTKYIGGHSDILIGTVAVKEKHVKQLQRSYKNFGMHISPEDCYMALRGIRTMPTRLKAHEQSALEIATWLSGHKKVSSVLHPALPSCPGHHIWKRDFTGSTGLFTIILDKSYSFEAICAMINGMELFGIGASWGGYESLIIHFDPAPIRTARKWHTDCSCIRLYIGLENTEDLKADIEAGLRRLQ